MGQPKSSGRLGGGDTPSTPARKKLTGITAITRQSKQVYQIAFSYRGLECREIIDLPHTKGNEAYCTRTRAEIINRIARNDFNYAEFFPGSKRALVFGQAVKRRSLKSLLTDYKERVRKTLEPSTFKCYEQDIDNYLIPWVGDRDVKDLTKGDIRDWVGLRGVSLKRIQNQLLPLRNVLNEAVADGLIPASPLDDLDLKRLVTPSQRISSYEVKPYTQAEIQTLLGRLAGVERCAFQLWIFTGLRTSELVGLRWRSVDLEANTIKIVDVTTVGQDKARAKTPSGLRTIPLLPAARQALDDMMSLSAKVGGDDRVFTNPRGRREDSYWDTNKLANVWTRAHRGTGIEVRNPYQCRHTFASQLLSQGENIAYIARLLGHKNTEMVVRTYGKWVSEGETLGFDRPPRRFGMEKLVFACEKHANT